MCTVRFFLFTIVLFCFACNKEEEIDTCKDGLLSPGEEGVDCGGPCPPCPDPLPTPFAFASINGTGIQFGNYTLEKMDDWVINFQNDTVNITLNLGNGDSLGLRPLKVQFSKGKFYSTSYDVLSDGKSLFTNINENEKTLSFFLEADLTIDPDSPLFNPLDTLKIRSGDFENIPWEE
jgi:hypothetical protein